MNNFEFPIPVSRDGNDVSKVHECPHPLEVERGHTEYRESHAGHPTGKRAERPEWAKED